MNWLAAAGAGFGLGLGLVCGAYLIRWLRHIMRGDNGRHV